MTGAQTLFLILMAASIGFSSAAMYLIATTPMDRWIGGRRAVAGRLMLGAICLFAGAAVIGVVWP